MTREEERLDKRWREICAESHRRKELIKEARRRKEPEPQWFSAKEEAEHERILSRLVDLRDARQPVKTFVKNKFG